MRSEWTVGIGAAVCSRALNFGNAYGGIEAFSRLLIGEVRVGSVGTSM
jgi:hypothetical protein